MYCFPPCDKRDHPEALVFPVEHEKRTSELNGSKQDVSEVTMQDIEMKLHHITKINGNTFVYAGSLTCQDPAHWWIEEANNNATAPVAGEDEDVDDPEQAGEDEDVDDIEQEVVI